MRRACGALLLLVAAFILQAQAPKDALYPTFSGTLKSLTKKELGLERGDGNVLVFSLTRKTRFLASGKRVDRSALHRGDQVSVQADEDYPGHLTAIAVSVQTSPF